MTPRSNRPPQPTSAAVCGPVPNPVYPSTNTTPVSGTAFAPKRHRPWVAWVLALATLLAAIVGPGCEQNLMPTPLLFLDPAVHAFSDIAPPYQSPEVAVFYATDRQPRAEGHYGPKRAADLTLGRATILIGEPNRTSWSELTHQSRLDPVDRDDLPLTVTQAHEFGPLSDATYTLRSFTPVPPVHDTASALNHDAPDHASDDASDDPRAVPVTSPVSGLVDEQAAARFVEAVNAQLQISSRKDIYVYVHGYKNGFDESVSVAGELWHFLQRRGVAIAYSWPARTDVFGYVHDRESAEYTSGHFREFLLFLARQTNAQRIHIICHSTGAAVVGTALRELRLIYYWRPIQHVRDLLKLGHLVFVAPDVDLSIFKARCFGEGLHLLPQTMTVYASPADKALNFARKVLYGLTRLGTLAAQNLSDGDLDILRQYPQVQIVNIAGQRNLDFFGHSHHTRNPSVTSDLVLLLVRDLPPEQRGLVRSGDLPMWNFPEDYRQRVQEIAKEQFPPGQIPPEQSSP